VKIDGSLLVRNTGLSFIALVLPLPIAILTVPFLIRGLGTERFGLLSLAWSLIGYFNLFDLGLGRATTKFVSEALGKDQLERIPHIIWTSLALQLAIGVFGAAVLATCTPLLV
jgi:O-antigen/teichoic acid export membrane protein